MRDDVEPAPGSEEDRVLAIDETMFPLPAGFSAEKSASRGGIEAYCRRMNLHGLRVHHDAMLLVDCEGNVLCVLDPGCAHDAYLKTLGGRPFVALVEPVEDPDGAAH